MKFNSKIRPICAKDIADRHPGNMRTQSDMDYALVGNKILKRVQQYQFMDLDLEAVREIVLRLTLYFEDVVSDLGIWRSFTSWCREHYGRYLPFYVVDDSEYHQDEPHLQDCMLITWYAFTDIIPQGIHYPFNKLVVTLSTEAFAVMDEEFENVAINEELKTFFQKADFTNDFYNQRAMLQWLLFGCYLTHTFENNHILEQYEADFSNWSQSQRSYAAMCKVVYNQKTGPLALYAKDYLAMILDANGCQRQSRKVSEQEHLKADLYKILSVKSSSISLKSVQGRKLEIPRDSFNEEMPWDIVKYIVASFVKYGSCWNLNGMMSNTDEATFLQEEKRFNETYEGTPNYKHLIELSGGSPLFYFSNKKTYIDFLKQEVGIPSDILLSVTKSLKDQPSRDDVTLFLEGEYNPIAMAFGVAKCIKDDRNPMYDKSFAEQNALAKTFDMPDTMVKYLVSNNMLPDAQFRTYPGEGVDGQELLHSNFDFFLRATRGNNY